MTAGRISACKVNAVHTGLGGDGRQGPPSQKVSQETGEGTEQLLSRLKIELGRLPGDMSAEATKISQELQHILGEIRGELRGVM